jgi:hypothetical protein
MEKSGFLQDLLLSHYALPSVSETCACGEGMSSVQCHDCLQYRPSCATCFVKSHVHHPFHWALVWDHTRGHYRKCDYTAVGAPHAIQLGHSDRLAPFELCRYSETDIHFIIVHPNGIHGTKIRFCCCPGSPDKITQLMKARLFPGTLSNPITAFSFSTLKQFHLLNLQSKCGAFDFILTLRRLTDNVTPDRVPVRFCLYLRM